MKIKVIIENGVVVNVVNDCDYVTTNFAHDFE